MQTPLGTTPLSPCPFNLIFSIWWSYTGQADFGWFFYLISDAACIGMVKLQLSEPNFRGESTQSTTGTLVPNLFLFVCVSSHLHLPLVFIYILLGYLALRRRISQLKVDINIDSILMQLYNWRLNKTDRVLYPEFWWVYYWWANLHNTDNGTISFISFVILEYKTESSCPLS